MIEVESLTVVYGTGADARAAVDGVSFRVEAGETFGLVGESGSGKSTVLRALAGLVPAARGAMRIEGSRLGPKRSRALFRRMQMVFQDPFGSLHPRQTVHSQLLEPLRIHALGPAEARIRSALDLVGLPSAFLWRYPHQLSGGQRQRVAIARALVLEPEILLLDEPTSALDVSVQAEILNLLADLRDARGLTFLLVSHDLGVIAHMCRRLAVMEGGRIVEELAVAALASGEAQHPYTQRLLRASEVYGEERLPAAAPALPAS